VAAGQATATERQASVAARAATGGDGRLGDHTLLLFAFSAGGLDAAAYLGLGHEFIANMTGNTALLGVAVARGDGGAGARSAVALAGFSLGVVATTLLNRAERGPFRFERALAVELTLLAGLLAGWAVAGTPSAAPRYALILAGAAVMGTQSVIARSSNPRGIATTYITGTLTAALSRWAARVRHDAHADAGTRTRAEVWLVYVAGALAGALAARAWPPGAAAISLAVILGVTLGLMRRPRRR
jgi:uncharacterized membrane protein YoaK (UPF0700 family)